MAGPPAHPPPASHGFGAAAAGAGGEVLIVEFKIIMLPPDVGAPDVGAPDVDPPAAGAGGGLPLVELEIVMLLLDVDAAAAGAGDRLLFVELEITMLLPDVMLPPNVDAPDGLCVGDAKDRVFMPPPGSIATALPRLSGSSQRLPVLVR